MKTLGVRVVRLGGAGSWMDSLQLLCSQDGDVVQRNFARLWSDVILQNEFGVVQAEGTVSVRSRCSK